MAPQTADTQANGKASIDPAATVSAGAQLVLGLSGDEGSEVLMILDGLRVARIAV